eukprot:194633_1
MCLYLSTVVLAIVLWFQCHILTRKLLILSNSLQPQLNSATQPTETVPSGCKLYDVIKSFWTQHKFWNQYFFIIASAIVTMITLAIHVAEAGNDMDSIYFQMFVFIPICTFIIIVSILSMIIHKYKCICCLRFISTDNKLRLICFSKTVLLLFKLLLLNSLADSESTLEWILRVLSTVSLITLGTVTYAFDWNFIQKLSKMRYAKAFFCSTFVDCLLLDWAK